MEMGASRDIQTLEFVAGFRIGVIYQREKVLQSKFARKAPEGPVCMELKLAQLITGVDRDQG